MAPDAISKLSGRLPRGSVVVSATNGKTTTATMVATVLEQAGVSLVHNRAGANMAGGVASALLDAARGRDGIAGELGLFEVDEFWLDRLTHTSPQPPSSWTARAEHGSSCAHRPVTHRSVSRYPGCTTSTTRSERLRCASSSASRSR